MPTQIEQRPKAAASNRALLRAKNLERHIANNLTAASRVGVAIGAKAYTTTCACRTSMLALALPMCHCPRCHKTWTSRSTGAPIRCPLCQYQLDKWRLRMGIQVLDTGQVMQQEQRNEPETDKLARELAS